MKISRVILIVCTIAAAGTFAACKGGGGDSQGGGGGGGAGWDEPIVMTADLSDAQALFSVQTQDSAITSESAPVAADIAAVTISDQSPLMAVTPQGLKNALYAYTQSNENVLSSLPRLSFVAVSPIGDVYLAFERAFVYTNSVAGYDFATYSDVGSASSPFTCQIFKVNKRINEFTAEDVASPPGLTCITSSLELDTWDFRASRIQFDDAGNAYFSAHVPNNWKNVLIKYNASNGSLSEEINANICFRDFMITGAGGILYTGITSTSGDCSGGDSFLRYRTPSGELQEITRGWWDYTFAAIESGQYSGQLLFFGPDPTIARTPDWDDSCLFRFDPSAEAGQRSTQIADCDIDVWQYVNQAAEADKPTRCVETKNMMGGGNQPEKILLVDSNGDGEPEVHVVGNIHAKRAGDWLCDLSFDAGTNGPCTDADNVVQDHTTQAACEAVQGNTWQTNQNWWTNVSSVVCTADLPNGWNRSNTHCEQPGGDWTYTYASMARVNDDANTTIDILSNTSRETVSNGWVINGRRFYAAFDTTAGAFTLIEVDETNGNSELLSGIEVYELFQDPRDSTKLFLNGLRFSDNAYIMGTFNPDAESPASTLAVEEGVTGQIETLVIVPEL